MAGLSPPGWSVSLSGDGRVLAVGGISNDFDRFNRVGATWVFVYDGVSYIQLGERLIGTNYESVAMQGEPTDYTSIRI